MRLPGGLGSPPGGLDSSLLSWTSDAMDRKSFLRSWFWGLGPLDSRGERWIASACFWGLAFESGLRELKGVRACALPATHKRAPDVS